MAANVAEATATSRQTTNGRHDSNELETQSSSAKPTTTAASNQIDSPKALADTGADVIVVYDVEHLATFSTSTSAAAAIATNGSHGTNNRSKQVNNHSKSKLSRADSDDNANADDDDDDDPLAAAESAATECGYGLMSRSSSAKHENVARAAGRSKRPTAAAQFDGCGITTPRVALRRLFELEKLSGIWTQRMQIELGQNHMLIVDCETNSVVEKFDKQSVTKPEAFNEYNHIYNNIVVFIIRQQQGPSTPDEISDEDDGVEGELHIFQCVSQQAQQLVRDILDWKSSKLQQKQQQQQLVRNSTNAATKATSNGKPSADRNEDHDSGNDNEEMAKLIINSSARSSKYKLQQSQANLKSSAVSKQIDATSNSKVPTGGGGGGGGGGGNTNKPVVVTVASSSSANENVPVVNVNVKETVQAFNQIAALREKSSKPSSPTNNQQQQRPLSEASATSSSSSSQSQANKLASGGQEEPPFAGLEATGASFFKQRSIRAKLSAQDQQQQKSRIANDSTTGSSSSSSTASDQAKHQQPTDAKQHQAEDRHSKMTNSSGSSNASSSNRSSSGGGFHQQHSSNKHQNHHQSSNGNNLRDKNHSQHAQATATATATTTTATTHSSSHQKTKSSSSSQAPGGRSAATAASQRSQSSAHLDQVTTNESYVSVLNHCFDDIEKFILKLQQSMAASRELQLAKRKLTKRSSSMDQQVAPALQLTASEMALLSSRARGPSEEDYFEILSKFKLAFNLLAKLKGCIHEPNAPELVHFLFTPLAIIIESARNAKPAIDPNLVGIPFLNQDALDLLSNCCTSKEYDMWMSLGPNWIQTIDSNLLKASRLPSSFQPIFSDGWAPIIGELELIGLVAPPTLGLSHELEERTTAAQLLPASPPPPPPTDRQHRHRHRHDHHGGGHAPLRSRHPSAGGYLASSSVLPADVSPPLAAGSFQKAPRNGHHSAASRHLSEPAVAGYGARDSHPAMYSNYADPTLERPPLVQSNGGATSPYRSSREIYHRPATHHPLQTTSHHHRPTGSSNRSGSVERRPNALRVGVSAHRVPSSGEFARQLQHKSSGGRDRLAAPPPLDELSIDRPHPHPHPHHHGRQPHYLPASGPPMKPYHLHQDDQRHALYEGASYPLAAAADDESAADYFTHPDDVDEAADDGLLPSNHRLHHHHHHQQQQQQHEIMLLDLGPAQLDWFYELQSRGALIVRVLFSRAANNDKELSVRRGEILEILDDSRKWWRARNIDMQVAHVPHTIVAPMQVYQTLDELLAKNPTDLSNGGGGHFEDPKFLLTSSSSASLHYARHPPDAAGAGAADDWHVAGGRNSKNAGAFRYF